MDTPMKHLLSDEELDLLVETAHLALDFQLFEQFDVLTSAIIRLRPDKPYPRIAVALGQYVRGQRDSAIASLKKVLELFPDAVFTRSLLARFVKEAGGGDWESYARQALEMSSEGVAADMAREVLGDQLQPDREEQSAAHQLLHARGLRA